MATTTNQAINKHLSELSDTERAEVLQYLQNYSILGNSVLEGFYLAQVNSVKSLAGYEARIEAIQAKTDEWANSLEPRLQAQAEGFFDGMTDFVSTEAVKVQAAIAAMHDKSKQHQATLNGHLKDLEIKYRAVADSERTKVTSALVATLKEKLEPHVEAAFKNSSDKFSMWSMGRDVLVMTIAFGIALGVKAWLF